MIEAIGPRFKIEANGKELGSFENDGFSTGGHSLLFASGGDAFYEFDNFELLEHDAAFPVNFAEADQVSSRMSLK